MFISIKSHVGNNHWEVTEICDEQKTNLYFAHKEVPYCLLQATLSIFCVFMCSVLFSEHICSDTDVIQKMLISTLRKKRCYDKNRCNLFQQRTQALVQSC